MRYVELTAEQIKRCKKYKRYIQIDKLRVKRVDIYKKYTSKRFKYSTYHADRVYIDQINLDVPIYIGHVFGKYFLRYYHIPNDASPYIKKATTAICINTLIIEIELNVLNLFISPPMLITVE